MYASKGLLIFPELDRRGGFGLANLLFFIGLRARLKTIFLRK
jgi:hypothetical protein